MKKVRGILRLKLNPDGTVTFRFTNLEMDNCSTKPIIAKDLGTAQSYLMSTWTFTRRGMERAIKELEETGSTSVRNIGNCGVTRTLVLG